MSLRLQRIAKTFVSDAVSFFKFDQFLTLKQREIIQKVKQFGKKYLQSQKMYECVQKAIFPQFLIQPLKQLDIMKYFVQKPYGQPLSALAQGMILSTLAQYDTSVSTFVMLQAPLTAYTIHKLGSQQQKNTILKDLIKLNKIGGWALTQILTGSNATEIQTNVTPTQNGFIMNGDKKWIGNGNRDIVVVWAKNTATKQVQGFIVNVKSKGVATKKIQNKLGLRPVQNIILKFDNVFLQKGAQLPQAKSYRQGVNRLLKHSRVSVCWIATGTCVGVYNHAIQYALKRDQFNQPIAGFQLIQQKLVKIMSNIQAMLLSCWRLSKMQQQSTLTVGQVGMMKAWITQRGRQVCRLGRQLMGGNGIIHSNFCMKAVCDMQVIYTYEGTYDINTLVAGRQLTGINAIKKN